MMSVRWSRSPWAWFVLVTVDDHVNAVVPQKSSKVLKVGDVGEGLQLFAQAWRAQVMMKHCDPDLNAVRRLRRRRDDRPQYLKLRRRDPRHIVSR
jgi:hypothetical protein